MFNDMFEGDEVVKKCSNCRYDLVYQGTLRPCRKCNDFNMHEFSRKEFAMKEPEILPTNDIDPHQPGVKLDAGKIDLDVYYRSFARTILFNLPNGTMTAKNRELVSSCLELIDTYRHEDCLRIAQALMDVFPVATWHDKVRQVADAGAKKHTPLGFLSVENGQHRYWLAFLRHLHAVINGEEIGDDFGFPHVNHMAWNVWAVQELSQ